MPFTHGGSDVAEMPCYAKGQSLDSLRGLFFTSNIKLRVDLCSSASRHRMLTANIDTRSHVAFTPHVQHTHTRTHARTHARKLASSSTSTHVHNCTRGTHTSSLTKGAYWSLLLSSKLCPIIILLIVRITNTTNNYYHACFVSPTLSKTSSQCPLSQVMVEEIYCDPM